MKILKILKIERRASYIRRIVGQDYVKDGLKIIANNGIPHNWEYQTDFPDIDLDFVSVARDIVKQYAKDKYVHTCNVGNWVTYLPASALQDAARALGADVGEIIKWTKNIANEFDELTLDDHKKFQDDLKNPDPKVREEAHREISKYQDFYDYQKLHPEVVSVAFRMVDKIKTQSTHAGGVIIADRPIDEIVPMSLIEDKWTSQWTEGSKTQLSKFGLVKFDILGVKTISYIWNACKSIKTNRNIEIDFSDMNPVSDPPRMGWITKVNEVGEKIKDVILMHDPDSLKMCNALKTDSVFQIETDIQKNIIKDTGVKKFQDLVAINALGRPGPMACACRESLINTNIGYIKIEELDNNKHKIVYLSKDGLKETDNFRVFKNGKKKVFKVVLSNGKTIYLTADHKIMTIQGYRQVKDIKNGDFVYAKK